uniref:CENP-V/GFA domain-containing protein n=1 Tax=Cacopsylla melanoneura TaxID=428564 RepID=A0A8D8XKP6_9HEMI
MMWLTVFFGTWLSFHETFYFHWLQSNSSAQITYHLHSLLCSNCGRLLFITIWYRQTEDLIIPRDGRLNGSLFVGFCPPPKGRQSRSEISSEISIYTARVSLRENVKMSFLDHCKGFTRDWNNTTLPVDICYPMSIIGSNKTGPQTE